MGFLGTILNDIKVGLGTNHPDVAHTIAPGQKISPAVKAQNSAPITNEYNAQGQPTQEVLNDLGPARFADGTTAHPKLMGGMFNPVAARQVRPTMPVAQNRGSQVGGEDPYQVQQPELSNLQHFYNPGYMPLQTSGYGGKGYTANIQPSSNMLRGMLQ